MSSQLESIFCILFLYKESRYSPCRRGDNSGVQNVAQATPGTGQVPEYQKKLKYHIKETIL